MNKIIEEKDLGDGIVWQKCKSGIEFWYKDGKLHRDDRPAVEMVDPGFSLTYEEWWQEGQLHRVNGPAIICANSKKWWYKGEPVNTEEDVRRYITDPEVEVETCQPLLDQFKILDEFKD